MAQVLRNVELRQSLPLESPPLSTAAVFEFGPRPTWRVTPFTATEELGKPPVIGVVRPYNQAKANPIAGYDNHHLDPPLGRNDPNYNSGPTIPVRNDNAGGRVPDGINYHTGPGGFQSALNAHIKELGFTREQWNSLPDETRLVYLRRYYSSLGVPFPK